MKLSQWKLITEQRLSALERTVSKYFHRTPTLQAKSVGQDKETSTEQTQQNTVPRKERSKRTLSKASGIVAGIVGLIASVFSFFPHITVSDPIQMDATDFFSYQMTVTNDGILPIYRARWAFAPRYIKVGIAGGTGESNPGHGVTWIVPHYADWAVTTDLLTSVIPDKPGTERHAAILFEPGSVMTVPGAADYEFHLRPSDNRIGTLAPGDGFTFTTEGLVSAPAGTTYDAVDFAIAISYTPIFPMIPMQTCSHFHIYKDRQGNAHWFRSTNQCDRFPWMHNWFTKSQTSSNSAK
jgi:hypothetical protein